MKEDSNGFMPEDQKSLAGAEEVSPLSRRVFIGRVGKIVALGTLAHFKLMGSAAFAANDQCCFGAETGGDVCDPPDNKDECPEGAAATDECTADDPPEDGADYCQSGISLDDVCPSGGGPGNVVGGGDECYGGGGTTTIGTPPVSYEQDNCGDVQHNNVGQGDACTTPEASIGFPLYTGGHDNCVANGGRDEDKCDDVHPDICDATNDDTCATGVSAGFGSNGQNDTCTTGISLTPSTDNCFDGSGTQDECIGDSDGDVCMGGQTDVCNPNSGDTDECPPGCDQADDICTNQPDTCTNGPDDTCHTYGSTPD